MAQYIDQGYARGLKRLNPPDNIRPFSAPARFSLVTVNYSTTHYLKLMLLTLCEQENLSALCRIVIVDNNSKDGGTDFLEQLAAENRHVHLLKNKFNCTHARGLRKGIDFINKAEQDLGQQVCSNALLVCDPDIVFLKPQTLKEISVRFWLKAKRLSQENYAMVYIHIRKPRHRFLRSDATAMQDPI